MRYVVEAIIALALTGLCILAMVATVSCAHLAPTGPTPANLVMA